MPDRDLVVPSPARDRVTVDLRGVGERLRAQAVARRMTTGAFVRRAVLLQLDDTARASVDAAPVTVDGTIVKVTLRLSAAHAVALATRARQADASQGAYVAGLLDGSQPAPVPADRADAIAALVASTDQLAALSTDISALTRLLKQANGGAAARYRERVDDLFVEVRQYLKQATDLFRTFIPVQRRPAVGRASKRR